MDAATITFMSLPISFVLPIPPVLPGAFPIAG
jgi:hypothetical protein